ncbi:MAG TPA: HisA/HisF-related TIM barrel protein [Gemmatimonadales bacterium]|nr:HisA/HisF-related TIM barrel protein [Gemmatimonadales bacterium]
MELYPAVDVRGGRLARAPQGAGADPRGPLALARDFATHGARWIHFVDLDRAAGRPGDPELLRRIIGEAGVPVQVGGGLAEGPAVTEALAWGAARVVLGARAAVEPGGLEAIVIRHGAGRLALALDVHEGRVAPRAGGSALLLDLTPRALAERAIAAGVRVMVYTDVARDGTLTGPDLAGARAIAALGLEVIASGGVGTLDHLRAARDAGLAGAIVGRALALGRFTLAEALACVA